MAAVTSYGPLYDRIYEALCTSTGKPSALAAADLFQRGFPNGVDPARRVMLARERPTVFVDVVRQGARGGDPELHTEKIFVITVQISVDFFLGWPMTALEKRSTGFNEVADAQTRSSSAFPKVLDALCYPNAHDTVTQTSACDRPQRRRAHTRGRVRIARARSPRSPTGACSTRSGPSPTARSAGPLPRSARGAT
jgi:hypothetical protein